MSTKAAYTIKDLEQLSGIKAHTIRIWEKRYSIISPDRTDTNIRTYCNNDLKRLLNIAILNKKGIKISRIAKLTTEELREEVKTSSEDYAQNNSQIESLILAMLEFDELRFEKLLNTYIIKFSFENTITDILIPFFTRIGVLWQIGTINPAQEHFVSNLFRQKLLVAIDGQLFKPREDSKTFVLFLPEGELHELGLLFSYYLLKKAGHKVIYLGQSLPTGDLTEIVKTTYFDNIFVSITSSIFENNIADYFNNLVEIFPDKNIYASGYQVQSNHTLIPSKVQIISSYKNFLKHI
jgi:MerR family transcriptional regulator, light-induced transcriptional regulator